MGKEVVNYGSTVNDGTGDALHIAFAKIDAGARLFNAIDKDLTAPPGSPAIGDTYIVGASATGAWATHDEKIAVYGLGSTWLFIPPGEGMFAYVRDENALYNYDGANWVIFSTGGDSGETRIELSFFAASTISANEVIFSYAPTQDIELPADLVDSVIRSIANATATAVLTLRKNGSSIGTATFSAGGNTATLVMTTATSFTGNTDIFTITGQASPDATLAGITGNIVGDVL